MDRELVSSEKKKSERFSDNWEIKNKVTCTKKIDLTGFLKTSNFFGFA
jgi:hypothetical protein